MAELERGSDYPQFSRPVLAFLRGGEPAVRELLPELWNETGMSIRFGGLRVAGFDDGLSIAVEVAGVLTDPSRPVSDRVQGFGAQASFEIARGHVRGAAEVLDRWEAQGMQPRFETALEKRAVMWTSSFVPAELAELEQLRDDLERLDYDTVYSPMTRPYLLGLVSARLGRPAESLEYASQLESHAARSARAGASRAEGIATYFATVVRAQLAYDGGDYEETLRLLDTVRSDAWWALVPWSLLLSQAQERYLRAQTLDALGRDEEALVWYSSFGWVTFVEGLYVAPALLRKAEIYERLGDLEQAAFHYRRFITRWRDCDPELRPFLAEAEQALARLTGNVEGS
jgi:tetratricopeptide (TPR) repeat protein